ncbi:MAG: 2TM domain-containing protein [Promethearchaeia archaeon]
MNEINTHFSEEALREIAAKKVTYRRSVQIHWALFVLVNILLFTVNFFSISEISIVTAQIGKFKFPIMQLWAFFPLFGWFIGIAMHSVAYICYATGVYPMAKRGVLFHATAYLSVTLLLVMINLIFPPHELWWVFYPGFFWLIAVIIHFVIYMIYYRGDISETGKYRSRKERAIEKEMKKIRRKMKKSKTE